MELARLLEQLVDVVPVDEIVDEGLEILRPGIPVVDVVAVLPDVDPEDRRAAVDQRVLAIGCLADLQLAVLDGEPGPAGTELRGAGGDEVFAELVVAAEVTVDRLLQRAGEGAPAAVRLHPVPEMQVVVVLAGI